MARAAYFTGGDYACSRCLPHVWSAMAPEEREDYGGSYLVFRSYTSTPLETLAEYQTQDEPVIPVFCEICGRKLASAQEIARKMRQRGREPSEVHELTEELRESSERFAGWQERSRGPEPAALVTHSIDPAEWQLAEHGDKRRGWYAIIDDEQSAVVVEPFHPVQWVGDWLWSEAHSLNEAVGWERYLIGWSPLHWNKRYR